MNKKRLILPDIPESEQTPLVTSLMALLEQFAERIQLQDEEIAQQTSYQTLNQTLKRIHNNKSELLLVLEWPEIPLHTNGSETDIRDYIKKRKISGGTRSDEGRRCRDTFASLKKTCRKLEVSFWQYLTDRLKIGATEVAPLHELIAERASLPLGACPRTRFFENLNF